ncbi:MAG TPA: rhodanese-like domain-containing protein [Bacteroidetes bacterium]|nr:rhodanese-like domain-containing protein [Bacteroidota bacterium]
MTIQELIQQEAKIIDVRTPEEFMGGNVPGSINIPLNEVPERVADFKEMDGPLILCCLSGGRSGQATGFLQAQGIECYNGGGWMDVNYAVSQQS